MCESHVELQGEEVWCAGLVWMRRMSSFAFRESCSCIFFFSSFLCMFQCCALYPSGVIHPYFLQPYLLLCNQLFSRPQTFLSKDSNVCSVVMDMLGIQQWAQPLAARVGVVYSGAVSCSSQNADFFFFFVAEVWTSCLITVHSSAEVLRSYTCLNTQGLKVGLFTDQRCWGLLALYIASRIICWPIPKPEMTQLLYVVAEIWYWVVFTTATWNGLGSKKGPEHC